MHFSVGIPDFFYLRQTKKLYLVECLLWGLVLGVPISFFLKVFRLFTRLLDAAGVVRAYSGKGFGYCYVIERGRNSCLFGHVAGILFYFHVKLFRSTIFISVEFQSSMSCILLVIELADENII